MFSSPKYTRKENAAKERQTFQQNLALRNDLVHGLAVIPNTILGALITFSDYPLYDTYAEVEHPVNIGLMTDQQLAGLLLWLLGDMMSIMAAATMMFVWFQQEEERE